MEGKRRGPNVARRVVQAVAARVAGAPVASHSGQEVRLLSDVGDDCLVYEHEVER